ncbi:MAG: type II toxin-antitoxin system RelE/ParE family toxin [Bauldia sp.]
MHTVVETNAYLSDAKAAGMTDAERRLAVDTVAAQPDGGVVMQGTGGCRKVRIAGRGKGKSGGYRVVTVYGGKGMPVFLLAAFSKDDAANLTKSERNELAKLVAVLFNTYAQRIAVAKERQR